MNLYITYRFGKNSAASVRLEGLDLLNQNQRVGRSVTGTTIIDSRFDGLRRYFMLTLGWKLSRFGE